MKKWFLFLFAIFILGSLTGCAHTDAPQVTQETTGPKGFDAAALAKYTIVYGENNPQYARLANELADHILTKYDIFLTTACHTELPPSPYEIILGDTNRSHRQGRIMEYSVTVDDGKFQINAGGAFSAEQAVNYLCENVFNGQTFSLDSGEYYQTSFLTKSQPVTEGTAARIMSANVLADAFADSSYKNAHYRAEIFAGMLISYTPDILGLQETDKAWNDALDGYLEKIQAVYGISYARHWATYEEKINYTSLLYRCDKFQVRQSGVHVFNWWRDDSFNHNYHMRNISWAEFAALNDAQQAFIVANTHWSYRTEHANGNTFLAGSASPIAENQLRLQCKEETNAFLTQLIQTYPQIPIFLTGDFNTSLSFFTESGWTPNSFRLVSEEAAQSGKSLSLVPATGHFDHLFGSGSYAIALFALVREDNQHSLLTDHPFVYADLTF